MRLGRLNRLSIAGFRSIKNAELTLEPFNLLIGPNGAGKSNFISLFTFMHKLATKDLQFFVAEQGGADNVLHFGRKSTPELKISAYFSPNSYSCVLKPTDDDRLIFASETCSFHADDINYKGGTKTSALVTPGALESGLPERPHSASARGHVRGYMLDWRVYHFHDTGRGAPVKQTHDLTNNLRLEADAGNLAAFLYALMDHDAYLEIVETVRRVAPFFRDFVLQPEIANPDKIRFRWRHRGSDRLFDVSALSDGTLRFICLVTLLLQPKLPTVIILDEPELGLHPHALELLGSIMKSVSTRTQIIASTQSVALANQFSWRDLVVVDRTNDASSFRRLEEREISSWIEDYGMGEIWAKNLIGGAP